MDRMTLSEFLLARIGEDESAARMATDGPWRVKDRRGDRYVFVAAESAAIASAVRPEDLAHIARHDPARVLAECEAKRRIVEVVSGWQHEVNREDCWYTCAAATEAVEGEETCDDARRGTGCDCGLEFRRRAILAPLALPYADHPDYRDEWRP